MGNKCIKIHTDFLNSMMFVFCIILISIKYHCRTIPIVAVERYFIQTTPKNYLSTNLSDPIRKNAIDCLLSGRTVKQNNCAMLTNILRLFLRFVNVVASGWYTMAFCVKQNINKW